ncbi:MAG: hypothetical protein ACJAS4_001922 [Bacteriovoracaceae bacterium]|jgi:hypothetical protein
MDELKKIIDLKSLSDQEIKDRSISLSDLWMVKDEHDKIFGPYDTESLKVYTGNHHHLFENSQTYNLEDEKWSETFSIPHFQRRKPALVSAQNLIANAEFYVLINDQQNGPYRKDEVQAFLNNGNITPSTLISLDKGESWIKLYEHHVFDRRTKKSNQELPFRPAPEILEHMAKTKDEILKAKEQEEAIIELAFIGHNKTVAPKVKNQKSIGITKKEYSKKESVEDNASTNKKKFLVPAFAMLALCVMVFAGSALINGFQNTDRNIKEAKTDVKSINNSQRAATRKPAATTRRVKPKKITKRLPKRIAPKRYNPDPQRRRTNARAKRKDVFEQDIEKLDINDPEVQEELTRQLAGEYEMDGEVNEEEAEEFLDEREDGYEGIEEREDHEEY